MQLVQQFEQLWSSATVPPDVFSFLRQQNTADSDGWLAVLLADQHRRWLTARPLTVEDYLAGLPNLPGNVDWKLQLAIGERCQETIPSHRANPRQAAIARLRKRLNPPLHRREVALFERLGQPRTDRIQINIRGTR